MPTYSVSAPDGSQIEMDGPQPPTEGQIRAAFLALKNRIRVPSDAKVSGVPGTDVLGPDPLGATAQGAANVYQKYSGLFNVAGSLKDVVQGVVPKLVEKVEQVAAPYIKAYHGSPHDFEKFDLSKIGTGEGAQAYGHGLYFAENPAVAQDYRDTLAYLKDDESRQILNVLPKPFQAPDNVRGIVKNIREAVAKGDIKKPSDFARIYEVAPPLRAAYAKAGLLLDNKGRMYEVAIHAQPEQLLDWDKPLSQQGPQVKEALAKAWLAHPEAHARQTGQQIYHITGGQSGMIGTDAQQAASQMLQQAGVPGLQYLDQGSRAAGQGTKNYVIFDDALVSILKKYGIAAPVIEALRQHVMGQQDQAQ